MNNTRWVKVKEDYNDIVVKLEEIIRITQDKDQREFWMDVIRQLQEAKKEAQQKLEQIEDGPGEISRYAQQEFEVIANDLNDMIAFIKEKFDLGDDDNNETGY